MKLLSLGWALLIVALCSIPGSQLQNATLLSLDKVGHFGMFFVGALLWTWPYRTGRVLAAGVALSVGTELYQGLAPFLGRRPDVFDVVADIVGLLAAFGLLLWFERRRQVLTA